MAAYSLMTEILLFRQTGPLLNDHLADTPKLKFTIQVLEGRPRQFVAKFNNHYGEYSDFCLEITVRGRTRENCANGLHCGCS